VSGTRAERYQVVLHIEPSTLQWGLGDGRSELEDGTHLSAETAVRLGDGAAEALVQQNLRRGRVICRGCCRARRPAAPATVHHDD
jgi:hypothetical protein